MSLKSLREVSRGATVTADDYNRLVAAVRECAVKQGYGITIPRQGTGGTVVALDASLLSGDSGFWAKITASREEVANQNRYEYSFVEVVKTKAAYQTGAWTAKENGRTGTYSARNVIEVMNSNTGTLGNGVAVSSLVGTFKMKPVPTNCIVKMFIVKFGQESEYWLQYENGVDGACP